LQVSEPGERRESIEPDVELPSTPGTAPKEAKGKAIHEPSTASHAAARQVDEPHQEKVSGAIPFEFSHHVSSNDDTPTPIVSGQSGHESRNPSDGPQDNNREKPATVPDAFPKAIHRALTSPSPAIAEDGKPIVASTPLSVEPAVVHRSVMNATGDHGAAATLEMPAEPQKASVISQLVEKAQLLVRDRNSEIVIALKPDSLGRITLRASMVDNELVTTIVAESHAVKTILQADLPALHSVLQEAGVETARVIVAKETDMNFAGGAPSNHSFEFQQPQHQSQQQAGSSRWYDEWASMNLDAEQPQLSRVPVSVDSRYAARSIHFIA
jgi:flagellar hook-length control protein FliK